ncbi:OmpA family protein [Microbacterium sp. NPDC089987]|uniref:OmpA family protein n=1 Tax=Microbacterium sp. NPDC089987 TaxID=3364202 RepID=UPI003808BB72
MTRIGAIALAAMLGALVATPVHASTDEDSYLDAEITQAMIAASTIDLDARASTIDLNAADATIELEQTIEEREHRTVRLTSDLLFAFDSADLTEAARGAVADLAAGIPDGAAVSVDGHTDSIGDGAYNDDLSRRRADAVAAVLAEARPDLGLTVSGHGERELLVKEGDGDQAPNRRVEVGFDAPRR